MLQTTKAFLPKMIENDRGHIATIASLAGHVGISKLVDYCASKFAAVSALYFRPCESPSELPIITGWLWWGFEAGAGSPWTYEHPNHLHLPLLHPGHWHVRRRECQVSTKATTPIQIRIPTSIHLNWRFDWVNDCRWVPTLNPNDVADRVIAAIRKNEKLAVIPGFLKVLLSFKWYVNKRTFAPA